jgi:hypothetical protein
MEIILGSGSSSLRVVLVHQVHYLVRFKGNVIKSCFKYSSTTESTSNLISCCTTKQTHHLSLEENARGRVQMKLLIISAGGLFSNEQLEPVRRTVRTIFNFQIANSSSLSLC